MHRAFGFANLPRRLMFSGLSMNPPRRRLTEVVGEHHLSIFAGHVGQHKSRLPMPDPKERHQTKQPYQLDPIPHSAPALFKTGNMPLAPITMKIWTRITQATHTAFYPVTPPHLPNPRPIFPSGNMNFVHQSTPRSRLELAARLCASWSNR